MNPILQSRFDALAGYVRQPSIMPYHECEWYELQTERLLGVIIFERVDDQFGGVVLGRDRNGRFRWVAGTKFFDEIGDARDALSQCLVEQSAEPDESYEQGDEFKKTTALLTPRVPEADMGRLFRMLLASEAYSPAKGLIEALSPFFRDLDGNFIQQFQTTAFDARLFELYLFAMLHEIGYTFDESEAAPDYHCIAPNTDFFIEAVTAQKTVGAEEQSHEEILEEDSAITTERASVKYGSALFSKLNKNYWERPHVSGHPLVFAIQNFSAPLAMMNTTGLSNYLYGWRHSASRPGGHLVITPSRIEMHELGGKRIPSDFFALPLAEHVSAVIFNPHATLPKFNRMGILAGFGSDRVDLIRRGFLKNHDPDASEPTPFAINVRSANYSETWVEGLNVYHNPRARISLDPNCFPGAAHHFIQKDGMLMSFVPEYFPMSSITFTMAIIGK